jgi:hypothetical protein
MWLFIVPGHLRKILGTLLGVLCLPLGASLMSQGILRPSEISPSDSVRMSSLGFERFLNTYIWNGGFQFQITGSLWDIDIDQKVRSRYIKTNEVSIEDEYTGAIMARLHLSERWNLQVQNSSDVVADSRVIDLGRMSQHQVLGGLQFGDDTSISAIAGGGYEFYSQEDEQDHGFTYRADVNAQRVRIEEFLASFRASWNQSLLGRRSPNSGGVSILLYRDFGHGVGDSLAFDYTVQRREFYTSLNAVDQTALGVQHDIFRRDASAFEATNQLRYDVGKNISLLVIGGMSNQLIDRGYALKNYADPSSLELDTRIQELQLFGNLQLRWSVLKWLALDGTLSTTEREEKHIVQEDAAAPLSVLESQQATASRLENTAQRTVFTVGFVADISRRDLFRGTSLASILHYDTPDTMNIDDRDELLLTYGIEEIHRFSQSLTSTLGADLTLSHLVYLNRLQSANNNWNRVLRLSSKIDYEPSSRFRSSVRAEVLANYTVSDYELQVPSVKSYSFRQAFWSDSTVVQIGERIQFKLTGSLRIFERGILQWDEFKEQPEDYYVETAVWPELFWTSKIGLRIGLGFRYFGQNRYRYSGIERIYDSRTETLGPTVTMDWRGPGRSYVWLTGWRDAQKADGTTTAIISNVSMKVGFVL